MHQEKELTDLSIETYKLFSSQFTEAVFQITAQSSVVSRDVPGGTAPKRVKEALAQARARVGESQ